MKLIVKYVAFISLAISSWITLAQTIVRIAPPAPVHIGVVGRAPQRGYVWIEGYQRWDGKRYVWVAGRWGRPPRVGAVWVAPVWVHRGNGWVFRTGYWR